MSPPVKGYFIPGDFLPPHLPSSNHTIHVHPMLHFVLEWAM